MFKSWCNIKSHVQEYECQVMSYVDDVLVSYDGCLWQELKYLWNNGVKTIGCCCGNHVNSLSDTAYIQVEDESIDKMVELGYTKFINEFGVTVFKPKTIIKGENNGI